MSIVKRVYTALLFLALVVGCSSNAPTNQQDPGSQGDTANRRNNPVSQEPSNSRSDPDTSSNNQQAPARQNTAYYEGNGGKGVRITILQPDGEGLVTSEQWMPIFMQGYLTANFNKYSAMTVLDRQNLDRILTEQTHSLSGNYADEDYIRIGQLTNAEYVLAGKLIKISPAAISVQLSIAHIETGERKASFLKTCTLNELKDSSVIAEATLELLSQMGITMNKTGMEAIKASQSSTLNAQTTLSKGIAAQRDGTIVEALSYYYESISFDPALTEASKRLGVLSSSISSGNIVQSVRYDFQQRDAWVKILKECEDFYSAHLPYEIIYNPELTQKAANYEKRTVDLEFALATQPTTAFKVIQDILEGLKKSGKKDTWGFAFWPLSSPVFAEYYAEEYSSRMYRFKYNNEEFLENRTHYFMDHHEMVKMITINTELVDQNGKILASSNKEFGNHLNFTCTRDNYRTRDNIYEIETLPTVALFTFKDINIEDLTDNVYVRITSINGIDTETAMANGYINVSTTHKKLEYPKYKINRK